MMKNVVEGKKKVLNLSGQGLTLWEWRYKKNYSRALIAIFLSPLLHSKEKLSIPGLCKNWRGAWNKAPSDFWWIAKFSFQFSLCMFLNQRENLT